MDSLHKVVSSSGLSFISWESAVDVFELTSTGASRSGTVRRGFGGQCLYTHLGSRAILERRWQGRDVCLVAVFWWL